MAAHFAESWGLDERSRSFLESLPVEVLDAVINNFTPREGTRNIDAKLTAFARKTAADMGLSDVGQGATQHVKDFISGKNIAHEIEQFISRWGLDEVSEKLLRGLPESQLVDVMLSFDPPPATRNVNAMFCKFVRSSRSSRGGSGLDRTISQFVQQWGLDETSEQLLRGQSSEVVSEVVQSFDPPPNTRNMNAVFCAFLRGSGSSFRRSSSGRFKDCVGDFVNRWSLDESCLALLQGFSPEAQDNVISSFDPGPETQNVSAKFTSFVRNMDKAPLSSLPPVGQYDPDVPLDSFIMRWGLDDMSENALRQLQSEHLKQVMHGFAPPPDTQNVSAKLMSFLKSVPAKNVGNRAGESSAWSDNGTFASASRKKLHEDAIESFAQRWQLDQDAQKLLRGLPQETLTRVMNEFNPPPDTKKNASGRLQVFVRTKLETINEHSKNTGGGTGWSDRLLIDLSMFVAQWRLDSRSEELLMGLEADILSRVMEQFPSHSGTRNPDEKLASWVRQLTHQKKRDEYRGSRMNRY